MSVTFQDAFHTVRSLLAALYAAADAACDPDIENAVVEAAEKGNKFLTDAGHEPYSWEEWRDEHPEEVDPEIEDARNNHGQCDHPCFDEYGRCEDCGWQPNL